MFGVGLAVPPQGAAGRPRVAGTRGAGRRAWSRRCWGRRSAWPRVGLVSAGLVFGLAISVASTVVLMRVLADAGDLHTPAGHIAVGWLVVEDLLTVLRARSCCRPSSAGTVRRPAGLRPSADRRALAVVKVAAMVGAGALSAASG